MPPETIARVAVAAATYVFDKPYDYLVPAALVERVAPGVRITVPFGRGNRCSEALVLSTYTGQRQEELKLFPVGDVWNEFCARAGVPAGREWLDEVQKYEREVLRAR